MIPLAISKRVPLFLLITVLILYNYPFPWLILTLVGLLFIIFGFSKNKNFDVILLIYIVAAGIGIRFVSLPLLPDFISQADILPVISEAINGLLKGTNPYQISYTAVVSNDPAHALPYPPFSFLFYLPFKLIFGNIQLAEIISATLVMLLIVVLATLTNFGKILITIAIYSLSFLFIMSSVNGSNDTSASLLIFSGFFLIIIYRLVDKKIFFYLSAVFVAFSLTFKQYSLIFAIFLLFYLYQNFSKASFLKYLATTAAALTIIILPFLIISPVDFVADVVWPTSPPMLAGWNIYYAIEKFLGINFSKSSFGVLSLIDLVATFALLIYLLIKFKPRTLAAITVLVPFVFFISLLLAPFASPAYLAAFVPLLVIQPIAADLDKLIQKNPGNGH